MVGALEHFKVAAWVQGQSRWAVRAEARVMGGKRVFKEKPA